MKYKMVPLVMTPQFPLSIILLKILFCFTFGEPGSVSVDAVVGGDPLFWVHLIQR